MNFNNKIIIESYIESGKEPLSKAQNPKAYRGIPSGQEALPRLITIIAILHLSVISLSSHLCFRKMKTFGMNMLVFCCLAKRASSLLN